MRGQEFDPPSLESVLELIDEWLDHGGKIRIDGHLKYDRAYRHINPDDCRYLLRNGRLSWPPEWDGRHRNRVYHIGGYDLDETILELLFVIDYEDAAIVFFNAKSH